ncbi:hypothetical protein FOL46_006200 [Perkinsus olseni]|uniref:Uncharacterized protein n=1 Tax=Perkinsus olseni TaxID=32597 RepID=A0A7J6LLW8_PEROL|nr:hypothetical protein FOL46_006200 [Perkinsus olseni]
MYAREKAGLSGKPTKHELSKFVRTVIIGNADTARRLVDAVKSHMKRDDEAIAALERSHQSTEGLMPAEVGARLITTPFLRCLRQQLIHILNNCVGDEGSNEDNNEDSNEVTDEEEHSTEERGAKVKSPFVTVSKVNFRASGVLLDQVRSQRGSSRCESLHSSLSRLMAPTTRVGMLLYTIRLQWFLMRFNRRRIESLGLRCPPEHLSPLEVEIMGVAELFNGWSLAPETEESELPLVGFEYAEAIAGSSLEVPEEIDVDNSDILKIEDPLEEPDEVSDPVKSGFWDGSQYADFGVIDERSEQPECLAEEVGSCDRIISEAGGPATQDEGQEKATQRPPKRRCVRGKASEGSKRGTPTEDQLPSCPSPEAQIKAVSGDLFEGIPPGQRRNLSKKKSLLQPTAPSCIPPDFNSAMEAKWVEILADNSIKYAGTALVRKCLGTYKSWRLGRLRELYPSSEPLLDVAYGQADRWIRHQLKYANTPYEVGDYTAACADSINQAASTIANPIVSAEACFQSTAEAQIPRLESVISEGPPVITDKMRMEERCTEIAIKKKGAGEQKELGGSAAQPNPTPAETSRYVCPFCKLPLAYGKNSHTYTARAWRYGVCPKAPAVRTKAARQQRVDEKEGVSERRDRAKQRLTELGLSADDPSCAENRRKKICTICSKLWQSTDNGVPHRFIGRGVYFCPYADDEALLRDYEIQKKERTRETERAKRERRKQKQKMEE